MRLTPFLALASALISTAASMPTNTTLDEYGEYEEVFHVDFDDHNDLNLTRRDIVWGPFLRVETFSTPDCKESTEIQHKDMKPGRCHANYTPFKAIRVGRDQKIEKWEKCVLNVWVVAWCAPDTLYQSLHFTPDVLTEYNLGRCIANPGPWKAMKVLCKPEHTGKKPPKEDGWSGDGWKDGKWDPKHAGGGE